MPPPSTSTDAAAPPAQQPQGPVKEIPVFEFTKRKRWADLLVTEVNDTIILVLSDACHVWYCGNAVTELLGWRDDELVDGDFIDLMNGTHPTLPLAPPSAQPRAPHNNLRLTRTAGHAADDRAGFRAAFAESVRTRTELLAYARLQCKNEFYVAADYTSAPREVLFELRGRPHFLPDSDAFQCFFAMAQPYPSRNTAMCVLGTRLLFPSPLARWGGHRALGSDRLRPVTQAQHVPRAEDGE